jgi:nucleotide-binding universal stress UspA family protein
MSSSDDKYGILVGVDGSAHSDAAVRFGTHEATLRNVPLTLMHVIESVPAWATASEQSRIAQVWEDNARDVIERAEKTARASAPAPGTLDLRTEVVCSPVVPMLRVASTAARMVVVGSRGMTRLNRFLLGSVSAALVRHAECPVAVVHEKSGAATEKLPVLVGVDGSPASEAAIKLAFEEAARRDVQLVALHAWSEVGVFPVLGMDWRNYEARGGEILSERLAGYRQEYPDVHVQRRLVCDRPTHWLLEESGHAQLVVVGCRGRGGFPGMLLGSVSSTLAQSASAPVIIAR